MKPRHVAGLSIYGPYFTGDPLDHAEEEYLDEWHYIQAARRERYAYKLALRDIMARIRYAGCQDAVILDLDRMALQALSQEFEA